MSTERISTVINALNELKTNNPGCGEMFCTTCGGIFRRIIEVMGTKTINDIKEILKVIGLDDMDFYFKDWSFILNYVDSKGYTSVFIREVKKLDLNNIDAIDKFLLKTRRMNESDDGEFSLLYGKVLKYSISKAVADSNESLAETVILSLQDKVKDHPELLDYVFSPTILWLGSSLNLSRFSL